MGTIQVWGIGFDPYEEGPLKSILEAESWIEVAGFVDFRKAREQMREDSNPKRVYLVRMNGRDDLHSFLKESLANNPGLKFVAVVDDFDPELALSLAEAGCMRLIPMNRAGDLLVKALATVNPAPGHAALFQETVERGSPGPGWQVEAPSNQLPGCSVEWYQQIFQWSPVGIAIADFPDGRILDANENLLRLLEERKEDVLQKRLNEIGFLPSIGGRAWVDTLIRQGSIPNHDLRLVNHVQRSLRVSVSVDRVDLGGQNVLLLIVQDMTGRVEMEDKIRRMNDNLERHILERTAAYDAVNRELESEIGLRRAVEESTQRLIRILWETPDMVAISEPGGRFQYVNKAGRRRFGIGDGDSISSWSVFDVYPPDLHDFVRLVITPEVHQKGIWFGETEFQLPDGQRMPVEQTLLAHRDEDGNTIFYSSVARDISDQQRASIELEKALARERELGALRTNFFTMASHQFRTPLSGILSSAELLEFYGASWPAEKRMTHLKRIQDAAHRLNKMLDHILAIGHLESIPEEALTDTIDLVDLVQRCADGAVDADGRRHTIQFAVEKPIYCARTSEELVERVMDNLISNALKYSREGSSIEIRMSVDCQDALVEILDHGIGIPEEEHDLIFHPFFRGSNIADIEGNGLGLMIVEKALGLLGGKISLSSQLGSGTKALVRLPIRGSEAR